MRPAVDNDDIGAIFRAKRERSQQKRQDNREFSTGLLTDKGIFFTSHNMGAHLVVLDRWNFWPGTGKFSERRGTPARPPRKGRGIHKLLEYIEEDQQCSSPR